MAGVTGDAFGVVAVGLVTAGFVEAPLRRLVTPLSRFDGALESTVVVVGPDEEVAGAV